MNGDIVPFFIVIEKENIEKFIQTKLNGSGCFLVDIQLSTRKLMIFIDREEGISVKECAQLNRELQKEYELSGLLETHDIIVSSPGLEYPFKVEQQYVKNIGRPVKITTFDGLETEGILQGYENGQCTLVVETGIKQKEISEKVLPLSEIKETKIIIKI